ncbi:MAG: hypothetical protein EBE86_005870 [Hormoscilla sp. GUM202]|nr:hypothetical protein [Hormoscilla sp. GUM202]
MRCSQTVEARSQENMTAIDSIKQEPETGRREVVRSVNDLLSSQNQSFYQSQVDENLDRDPLSEFIGAVEHGYLAENMDAEIYET